MVCSVWPFMWSHAVSPRAAEHSSPLPPPSNSSNSTGKLAIRGGPWSDDLVALLAMYCTIVASEQKPRAAEHLQTESWLRGSWAGCWARAGRPSAQTNAQTAAPLPGLPGEPVAPASARASAHAARLPARCAAHAQLAA